MARCTCRYRDGEGPGKEPLEKDLYCPFHGRIRDMDSGASPFFDANTAAFAASEAYESDFQRKLKREANEADARRGHDRPMTRKEFVEGLAEETPNIRIVKDSGASFGGMPVSCLCSWYRQGEDGEWNLSTIDPDCPIHGSGDAA